MAKANSPALPSKARLKPDYGILRRFGAVQRRILGRTQAGGGCGLRTKKRKNETMAIEYCPGARLDLLEELCTSPRGWDEMGERYARLIST
jgi:hypothetical protein